MSVLPPPRVEPGLRRWAVTFVRAGGKTADIGVVGGLAVLLEAEIKSSGDSQNRGKMGYLWWVSAGLVTLAVALPFLVWVRRKPSGSKAKESGDGEL